VTPPLQRQAPVAARTRRDENPLPVLPRAKLLRDTAEALSEGIAELPDQPVIDPLLHLDARGLQSLHASARILDLCISSSANFTGAVLRTLESGAGLDEIAERDLKLRIALLKLRMALLKLRMALLKLRIALLKLRMALLKLHTKLSESTARRLQFHTKPLQLRVSGLHTAAQVRLSDIGEGRGRTRCDSAMRRGSGNMVDRRQVRSRSGASLSRDRHGGGGNGTGGGGANAFPEGKRRARLRRARGHHRAVRGCVRFR
jgi:hypothetical protein